MNSRKFLFLQGPATLFHRSLIESIEMADHEVYQVSFCGGDWVFGLGQTQWRFNGRATEFTAWIAKRLEEYQITDLVLFGDMRPLHEAAIRVAREQNLRIYVFEEGYLRPDWITLEKGGVNANSNLMSKDDAWYRNYSHPQVKKNPPTGASLAVRFAFDLAYRVSTLLLYPWFDQYQTHRPRNSIVEYLGWARRYPMRCLSWRREKSVIQSLVDQEQPYFFFPLQLDSDSQIRRHSPFGGMVKAIQYVVESFAKYAPANNILVIKNHPLDTGLIPYRQILRKLTQSLNIENRVIYLENGHIPTLTHHAKGTVVVNSTVGMSALFHHSPTCALGKSIYNLPGLTYQDGLDSFWSNPVKPDMELFAKFRNAVINLTQINGNFYSRKGIKMAVSGSLNAMGVIATVNTDETLSFYGTTSQSLN